MDLNLLLFRQQQERHRADAAASADARHAHGRLAALFERKIRRLTKGRIDIRPLELAAEGRQLR
jgi:hypothetical protein